MCCVVYLCVISASDLIYSCATAIDGMGAVSAVLHLLIGIPLVSQGPSEVIPNLHISEDSEYFIKNSSIGDMAIEDLEREAIERTLKFFNNNRRASAKSLGMSERTLYRKIDQYGLERKIKNTG